jgi:bifunctional non-homologous end joining protein LigD
MRPAITRRPVTLRDAVVEPLWSGARAIAHVVAGPESGSPGRLPSARLVADDGSDLADEWPELAAELGSAVGADAAVIDVVVTAQALLTGEGTAVVAEAWVPQSRLLLRGDAGVDVRRRGSRSAPRSADARERSDVGAEPGLVCLDLLALDGASLLDVPLLERKRLLESVVTPGGRLRVSVHTRPPADPWLATWKSLGLRGAMLKAPNSRYVPGGRTLDWRPLERIGARR